MVEMNVPASSFQEPEMHSALDSLKSNIKFRLTVIFRCKIRFKSALPMAWIQKESLRTACWIFSAYLERVVSVIFAQNARSSLVILTSISA